MKGSLIGQAVSGHLHPGHPEKQDVVAGDQHLGRVELEEILVALVGPAERGKRPQIARKPGVEHVRVAPQVQVGVLRVFVAVQIGILGAGHVDVALGVVPGGNLVAPPQLARDVPVADILQPVAVDLGVALRHELHLAFVQALQDLLGQRLHVHEPLQADDRLDRHLGALAEADGGVVVFLLDQVAALGQRLDHRFAGGEALQAAKLFGHEVGGQVAHQVDDAGAGESMPLTDLEVGGVVRRGDLECAHAEIALDGAVGDDRHVAVGQRNARPQSDQMREALVFRMHGNRLIGEDGFGAHGGDQNFARLAVAGRRRRVFELVTQRGHLALADLTVDFQFAEGGLGRRVPVDDALAPVGQALVIQLDELVAHGA